MPVWALSLAAGRVARVIVALRRWAVVLVCLVLLVPAGCGGGGGHVHFAKTKFVLHAGLAFGAFHHFIYKPYRGGAFHGPHKVRALIKAGAAGLFAYHELKLAREDARSSRLLSKVVLPVAGLGAGLLALGHELKGGHLDAGAIQGANGQIARIHTQSASDGAPITEHTPPNVGG
jgi:hypothetical protein